MPSVLAIFAHPDDIEFRAAGTLLLLRQRGWDVHYCNLSNGNLGSAEMNISETALTRRKEAQASAKFMGATWHRPVCSDLQVFYNDATIRRVCALVRLTRPSVILTHPTQDYMEDHTTTCRLAVTGAFARGIPNYRSTPQRPPTLDPVTIYHSMPHGLCDPMRGAVLPEAYVDTSAVHSLKRDALACHRSQKHWLDLTQGADCYLHALDTESKTLGKRSGGFTHAEGWSRHLHIGFASESDNPLKEALGKAYRFAPKEPA